MTRQRHGGYFSVLFVLIVTSSATSVRGGSVRIWPMAIVHDDIVQLKDVAEIQGFTDDESIHLRSLVVHGSPRVGREILVRAGDVVGALSDVGVNLGNITIFGSSRCKVTRPRSTRHPNKTNSHAQSRRKRPTSAHPTKTARQETAPSSTQNLESALRAYITARIPHEDGRLDIRFSPTSLKALRLGGPDYHFTIRGHNQRQLGLVSYEVDIHHAGKLVRSVPIAAEVLLVRSVVVARRPINRGQVIAGRDLKLQERRFSRLEAIGLTELSAATGFQSRRFFKSGDMLQARSLQVEPLVQRGDYVKIVIRGQDIEIRTSGKAQAAGALGDLIPVRRDGSKRKQDTIDAVVVGHGLVTYQGIPRVASLRGK